MVDEAIGRYLHNGSGIDIIKVRAYIKRKIKEGFDAGYDLGWSEASKCDFLDGSEENPGYNNFKEYFKKKYK